jgi:hypothetical protein
VFLPPGVPPTLPPPKSTHDWSPYRNDIKFATAEFTFKQRHMSNVAADTLFDLMAALLAKHDDNPPFADHKDLHKVIDATQLASKSPSHSRSVFASANTRVAASVQQLICSHPQCESLDLDWEAAIDLLLQHLSMDKQRAERCT